MDENNACNKLEKIRYISMQSSIICDMHVMYDTCIYKKKLTCNQMRNLPIHFHGVADGIFRAGLEIM